MNTKTLVSLSLLVGIGAVLHAIMPPVLFGMKPDMMLTMMFLGILLFPGVKNVLLLGLTTGAISALTTGFPGGQVPNIIDKPITAFIIFGLLLLVRNVTTVKTPVAAALTAVGTLVSGIIFLSAAALIVGLPGDLMALIVGVVLPATVVNTIVMVVVYPIVNSVLKRTSISAKVS
ncbi:tryptophan transporter [Priestia flexa]|uniref:Tryptophan transporter n=1 Tax=Priestia flexa TaxID=86664 RepID=A0ABU4J2W6_9BACI|nr:tryptophan transporter [Priestia flexa]MDW8515341.1 tryptophan transporter [Priestia flexa]